MRLTVLEINLGSSTVAEDTQRNVLSVGIEENSHCSFTISSDNNDISRGTVQKILRISKLHS